jgi:lipid A 3-O-deacylase
MIQRGVCYMVCFVLLSYIGTLNARDCISVGAGDGTRGVRGYRGSWEHSWPTVTSHKNQKFTGYWDLAYTDVSSNDTFDEPSNGHAVIISASPVLRIPFKLIVPVYIDAGIGIAHLSNRLIANRDLGSVWVFEDRLGAGALLGARQSLEIGYRFLHYSNAYLAQKNQGLNLHLMIVGYWFNK